MGYTTEFTGAIGLSRKLTMAEAKELLEIDETGTITGIREYFQWVPSETLDQIVWDGNEKFYKYTEQLEWAEGAGHSGARIEWLGRVGFDPYVQRHRLAVRLRQGGGNILGAGPCRTPRTS
jgi:hypothetical protein